MTNKGAVNVFPYILATAGHVDHGKSALVRALTGIDPDRLPEEKARGITIELGFAHLDLPGPAGTCRVGVVDVPGHEDFVKNMVAGVGSVDLALLVVAADDGWMPQTEEHLQILTYAGVNRGVVALTKADLAASVEAAIAQVRHRLRGSPLAEARVVPTSIPQGTGIVELKSALAEELAQSTPQPDVGKPRLAVDRAFTLRGTGTVVTGTLTGGVLRRGQGVVIQPAGRAARVRTVQSYNRDVEQASPGSRVALNLPDVQPGSTAHGGADVGRGDVVTLAELGRAGDTIDVLLEVSPRAGSRPLKEGTLVRFHHGSGNVPAFVYFHQAGSIGPGQRLCAQLRLESPAFAFAGDRFILRDWPEQHTVAGGVVLDPDAGRRGFRSAERGAFLQVRAAQADDPTSFVASELARDGAAARSNLLIKSRFSAAQIAGAAGRLVEAGTLSLHGDVIVDSAHWRRLRQSAVAAIDAAHRAAPQEAGMRLGDLRQIISKELPRIDVFDALVADLCRNGCVKSGVTIGLASHRPALPPNLQPAGAKLRAALSAKPLEPPSRKDLTPDALTRQALRFLVQSGEVIEVGDDLVLHANGYVRAVETVKDFIKANGPATVSELKQALNSSRRIMVPLLEKLDREGVTLRQGDRRVLKQPK